MPLKIKIFLFNYVIVHLYVDIVILIWLKEGTVLDRNLSNSIISHGKLVLLYYGFVFQ